MVFTTTLNQMLMFFSVMILGFILRRKNIVPENADVSLSKVLTMVVSPALLLKTFIANFNVETLLEKSYIFIWGIILLFILIFLGTALANLFADNRYIKYIYTYSFIIPNMGYMAQPLTLAVFGEEALFDLMIFSIPFNVYIYSVGFTRLNPNNEKVSLKSLVNPLFISMGIAIVLGLTKVPIPTFVENTLSALAGCMGVIAMLLAGLVIGKYDLRDLVSSGRVYVASFIRLIAIPGVLVYVLRAIGLPSYIYMTALCVFAMPMGLNTIVFPAAFGGDTKPGASMALISSIFGIITIPIMFAFFMA
ncbi:MAG: AEC family transporter [Clostridia bacterium]|nr:AEC family transporter [Clostridia bacterium]